MFLNRTHRSRVFHVFFHVLLLSALFVCAIAPAARAGVRGEIGVKTVIAIGSGNIYRESISAARTRAISDSLVSAVKNLLADMLPADALVTHFPTLNHILFEQRKRFIQNYKVLTEYKFGGKYRVLVQASILTDRVVQELASVGIVLEEKYLPKLLYCITEVNPEEGWPRYWWGGEDAEFFSPAGEKALKEAMAKRGFTTVGRGFVAPEIQMEMPFSSPYISNVEAAELGRRFEADVVVAGSAVAGATLNSLGDRLWSYRATVDVRAIRTDTGEEIAATVQTAVAVNADETAGGRSAIADAAKSAGNALADQIAEAWRKESAGPEMVEIEVTGTRHLADFVKLRKFMSGSPGVAGIRVKEIGINNATILVDYESDADALAAALMVNDFDTFGLHISDVSPGRMAIAIVKAGEPEGEGEDETAKPPPGQPEP